MWDNWRCGALEMEMNVIWCGVVLMMMRKGQPLKAEESSWTFMGQQEMELFWDSLFFSRWKVLFRSQDGDKMKEKNFQENTQIHMDSNFSPLPFILLPILYYYGQLIKQVIVLGCTKSVVKELSCTFITRLLYWLDYDFFIDCRHRSLFPFNLLTSTEYFTVQTPGERELFVLFLRRCNKNDVSLRK